MLGSGEGSGSGSVGAANADNTVRNETERFGALQQEIEAEGLVSAEARNVEYEVATGIVTLTGAADVNHPQYRISGEVLRYDMNIQHFEGSGAHDQGRIRIRLDPEVIPGESAIDPAPEAEQDGGGDQQPPAGRQRPESRRVELLDIVQPVGQAVGCHR